MVLVEPIIGTIGLDFNKVNGKMPMVLTLPESQKGEEINLRAALEYISFMHDIKGIYGDIITDCDGDALWARFTDMPVVNFPNPVKEDDIAHLDWKSWKNIEVEGQKLITTVLIDPADDRGGYPLGVAYSNRQSLIENFRPKKLKLNTERCDYMQNLNPSIALNIVTLYSRSRGIWPKGLRNPNEDKNAELPKTLEESSGNFLIFNRLFTNSEGNALLMITDIPSGHGFCHESYLYDENTKSFTIYENDKYAPRDAIPYRSCFHKIPLDSAFFRFCGI